MRTVRAIDRQLPGLTMHTVGDRLLREFEAMLPERAEVLVVGAGDLGKLLRRSGVRETTTDIRPGELIDVVCDLHDLPFDDATFDAVVGIAVLEHVADPWRCEHEMRRVLRPGGLVYSEVPFLQHVHAGAWDFTRFTLLGHRRLFRWFDTIALEPVAGPASSVAWAVDGLLLALFGVNRPAWLLVSRLSRLLLSCLPWLDRMLSPRAAADAACGTVFVGRLRTEPFSDEQVAAEYMGRCPTPIA
jgi:SAM-dependent methyltransferase